MKFAEIVLFSKLCQRHFLTKQKEKQVNIDGCVVLCTALYYCNMYVLCKMSGREEKQFSQRDVSVVHQVPLLHLQSGVQINIAVLLCRKYMMSQTDVSMNGYLSPTSIVFVASMYRKYIKITENIFVILPVHKSHFSRISIVSFCQHLSPGVNLDFNSGCKLCISSSTVCKCRDSKIIMMIDNLQNQM